jgi:hypothetical protein
VLTLSEHALREILLGIRSGTLASVRRRIVEPGGYTPWIVFAIFVVLLAVFQFVR